MFSKSLILSAVATAISSTWAQSVTCDPGTQSATPCFGGNTNQFCTLVSQTEFVAGGAISYCIGAGGSRCDFTALDIGSTTLHPTLESCITVINRVGSVCGGQGGRAVDGPGDPMAYTIRGNIGSCASDVAGLQN